MLADPRNANSLSAKFRRKRDVKLRALISSVAQGRSGVAILDMGGTVEYWERVGLQFLAEVGARVTVVNLRKTELSDAQAHGGVLSTAVGDACALTAYADNSFDMVHSNSVIEHVQTWPNMIAFAGETRRLAPVYYVQTPYFWFPFDPHYYKAPLFHWFPRPIRAKLLRTFPITHVGRVMTLAESLGHVDSARLLDGAQFRYLFPDARIDFERVAGLPKSMIAIRRD